MTTFVQVPAEALFAFLREKGFAETTRHGEAVFERRHHKDPTYVIAVFTSVRRGQETARECGKDAIRVCAYRAFPDGRSYGIAKTKRVHRTGSVEKVLARMLERMREAYGACNERMGR